jgi:hypothetical protein
VEKIPAMVAVPFEECLLEFFERPTVFVVGELQSTILMNTLYDGLELLVAPDADRQALVNGIITHIRSQENSGLIGRGDFDAMINLVMLWASLNRSRPLILHPAEIGEHKKDNLILIGGADVNSLTESLSPLLGCQLQATRDAQNHNMVVDLRLGKEYLVQSGEPPVDGGPGEAQVRDYGVLARGRNPDNSNAVVLIVAGAHGLGTFAATEVCVRDADQRRLYTEHKQYKGNFEALVSYERRLRAGSDSRVKITLEFARGLAV